MRRNELPVLHPSCGADDIVGALDEAGCCVVERAEPASTMDAILADLAPFADGAAHGVSDFEGLRTRRTGSVVLRSPTFRSMARHPTIVTAGDRVFADSTSWGLSSTELIEIFPGQGEQPIHRDQWKYDYVDLPIEVEVNAMWAISDFTEENGATRIIPGSHRSANDLRPRFDETVPAEMTKGSLLMYLGTTYHGGGANRSDDVRIGLSLQHAVGWVRQGEQFLLECPPAVVKDWDDDLVRFIGYQRGGDSLGVYGDSQDPLAAVHPERDYPKGWVFTEKATEAL